MSGMIRAVAAAGLVLAVFMAGCERSASDAGSSEVRLQGAGATFPNPVYQRWMVEYQKSHPHIKIDYQSIGSGGGIKGITEKTVDFAGSDAPMSDKEKAAAGLPVVQIPTCAGAVVLAYNLPGMAGELKLTGPIVAEIFMEKIKRWDDAKLAAINPGARLPDMPIVTAHRTDGSGTTFVFTSYLATQSDEFTRTVGSGKQVKWPGGQGGKGNEGVTAVVQQTPGAIGYVELNYAMANKLPFASLQNKDGQFVKASLESVSAAGEGALAKMGDSLAVDIWNQPGANAYPIAAFTYIIAYKDLGYLKSDIKAQALVDFLNWASGPDAGKLARELDYAPLSEGVQSRVSDAIGGLTFNGKPLPGQQRVAGK